MTDMTNGMAAGAPRAARNPRTELAVYFAAIFVETLPLALLAWALTALRTARLPQKGPVARAWSQARVITPMIFSA